MNNTTYFRAILWFLYLTVLPCVLFAQNEAKYPIEISDINLPAEVWEPQILVSAIVKDPDYYTITMQVQGNANCRKEIIVNPFTLNNFIYALRKGRSQLLKQFTLQNVQEELTNSQIQMTKQIKVEDSVRDSLDSPKTPYETALFYQFKGSEIATPVGFGRPEAGRLYFSSKLAIQKKTDDYHQRIFDDQIEEYVNLKWAKYLKESNQDPKTKIGKGERKSLETAFTLDDVRKKNSAFEEVIKSFWYTLQSASELSLKIEQYKSELENGFISKYKSIENINDTAMLKTRSKDLLLKQFKHTYEQIKMSAPAFYQSNASVFSYESKAGGLEALADSLSEIETTKYLEPLWNFILDFEHMWNVGIPQNEVTLKMVNKDLDSLSSILLPSLTAMTSFNFNVTYVELEFNEGFIENILVFGTVETLDLVKFYNNNIMRDVVFSDSISVFLNHNLMAKQIKFENKYPFGFSRKKDYEDLAEVELFSNGNEGEKYKLKLGDLITVYLPKHEVGRRDFSPENRVIQYDPLKGTNYIILYKEETSKLFEARVFSDFVGLDAKAANGLLQTEIAKRLNLNTKRLFVNHNGFWRGFGGFSWLEPTITLSKIEQNNKNLLLTQVVPNDTFGRTRYYTTTLDVRRHESLSVGARLNVLSYDLPGLKSTLSANGAFYYGRTPIQTDTMEGGINTLTFSPEVNCDVRADERWGLSFSYRRNFMRTMSRDVVQISDLLDTDNHLAKGIKNKQYQTFQFQVFFQPSEDNRGRLFFRYRYHWQFGDQNLGFHQAQVGYSFYLLGRNKGKETK